MSKRAMPVPMLSEAELAPWKNRLCLWISVSKKFTYIVHIGRYRNGLYIKETAKSSRYKTSEEAWEEVFADDFEILDEKPYVFKALVPETTNWYSIENLIAAERELDTLTKQLFIGGKLCI